MESTNYFLKTAKAAAVAAGPVALRYFNKQIKIIDKHPGQNDWVTLADINVEKKIVNLLLKSYPQHNFQLEEAKSISHNSQYTWYIDSISNTCNFIRGLGHFSIVISLYRKNQPLIALAYDPAYQELFWAQRGKGAWFNKNKGPLKVSKINKLSRALGILRLEPKSPQQEVSKYLKIFSAITKSLEGSRNFGSNPLHLGYLAAGKVDFYINHNVDPRSHAAGYLIVKEAGGKMTDFKGREWQLGEKTVIASNKTLHQQLLNFFL